MLKVIFGDGSNKTSKPEQKRPAAPARDARGNLIALTPNIFDIHFETPNRNLRAKVRNARKP